MIAMADFSLEMLEAKMQWNCMHTTGEGGEDIELELYTQENYDLIVYMKKNHL